MTRREWLWCEDPERMLKYLARSKRFRVSDRKLRLFGLACCQRIAQLFVDPRTKNGLGVVERYADGLCSKKELQALYKTAGEAYRERQAAVAEAEDVEEWLRIFPHMDPEDVPVAFPSEY